MKQSPKEFIINNSEKFAQAVENGYDIRMDESEIFEWMEKYRAAKLYYYLEEGEIIQYGDEVTSHDDPTKWVLSSRVGAKAPGSEGRPYRRLIKD